MKINQAVGREVTVSTNDSLINIGVYNERDMVLRENTHTNFKGT